MTLSHGTAPPEIGTRGPEGIRCAWDEDVCDRTAEHVLAFRGADTLVLCPRHDAAKLAWLLDLHMPDCDGGLREHIATYGPIAVPRDEPSDPEA